MASHFAHELTRLLKFVLKGLLMNFRDNVTCQARSNSVAKLETETRAPRRHLLDMYCFGIVT